MALEIIKNAEGVSEARGFGLQLGNLGHAQHGDEKASCVAELMKQADQQLKG